MAGPLTSAGVNQIFNFYSNTLFAEKQQTRKRSFIHRLVYVGTTNPKSNSGYVDNNSLAEYYEKRFNEFQNHPQIEKVTGMLLLCPKSVIHILESSLEVLTQILKDLSDQEKNPDAPLREVRVLVMSYIIESRIFPSWRYGSILLPLAGSDGSYRTRPVEIVASECLTKIYRCCDVQGQCPELQEETVLYLCQNQVLHSPSSFLKAYTKPTDILMDSESHPRLYWQLE